MDKNTKTLLVILSAVAIMVGMAFASVPLYRMFCQVTGFGGTTMRAEAPPPASDIIDREITVKFNADTAPSLPWTFKPDQHEITVKIGQQGIVSYLAKNKLQKSTTGTAIYNVAPAKAGKYFHKVQCFCFDEQTLTPGQEMHMPVMFYVDPALARDKNLDDIKFITLSYTFFPADSAELDQALEEFYNAP